MKLIIDIDEEIYKSSKQECAENDSLIIDNFTLTIGNGIPLEEELEKIKAEIDEIVEREMKEDMRWSLGLRHSKKIIDNHIKELKGDRHK